MMTIQITASGRNFSQAVKFLKKLGGQFDSVSKLWTVAPGKIDGSDCNLWGLRITAPAVTLDSVDDMDRENSKN